MFEGHIGSMAKDCIARMRQIDGAEPHNAYMIQIFPTYLLWDIELQSAPLRAPNFL
jgi:hypothetical protein